MRRRLHKAERIKVFRSNPCGRYNTPPLVSFFDTSCGQLGEMQKRRMSKTPSPRIDFPHMPTTHQPDTNYQLTIPTWQNVFASAAMNTTMARKQTNKLPNSQANL